MKKFSIYDSEKPEPKPTMLALRDDTFTGEIELVAVDPDTGETVPGSFILRITQDGRIIRHYGVNSSLGFRRDDNGRVELADY